MIYRPVRHAGDIIIGRESGGVFGGSISSSSVRSVIGCASRSWMIYRPVRHAGDAITGRESGGAFGGSISSLLL
jgi:hypothetical protein